MTYQLVFDASAVRYPIWEWIAPWLAAALIGAALIRWPSVYGAKARGYTRIFGALLLLVGLGSALGVWRETSEQRERLVSAARVDPGPRPGFDYPLLRSESTTRANGLSKGSLMPNRSRPREHGMWVGLIRSAMQPPNSKEHLRTVVEAGRSYELPVEELYP